MAMKYFRQIMSGINPAPLLAQVAEHPELWGAFKTWTEGKPESVLSKMGMAANNIELSYNKGHPNEWDRPAFHILSEVQSLIFDLMTVVKGRLLGRAIISRMAPGDVIKPHVHEVQFGMPRIFDTFQIPLQVDPGVVFGCGDEELYMEPGTAWTFDNQVFHWVRNGSDRDRISLMVDIRPFIPIRVGP